MDDNFIPNISSDWLESLYDDWRRDAESIPREWQIFFSGFELGIKEQVSGGAKWDENLINKHSGVQSLIFRYRSVGHLLACTDPLSPCLLEHPLLSLSVFGLNESDLDTVFIIRNYRQQRAKLREILTTMMETYCREIGVEYMHIQEPGERQWLMARMESCHNRSKISNEEKLHLLEKLHEAALFESFLHRHFIGQKRFSLEGGDTLIPMLDAIVRGCPAAGVSDLILGMAHRGRLNVLAHIFGKPYENIFAEFRDNLISGFAGDGDVKYHKGYSTEVELPDGRLHLTIAANPSHLEAVNPVVEGKCRARQDRYGLDGAKRVLPLLIHGDAAFAGQGSVMETLNMSQLEGYRTGGTIHIVLNNQIGFTTLPKDARSTSYATDVAKMLSCPVFHVQGEALESVIHVVRMAMEYRRIYGRDVVVELICYRRHGHNEGDEPAFTQPVTYQNIADRPPVNKIYADLLAEQGVDPSLLAETEKRVIGRLESALNKEQQTDYSSYQGIWSDISPEFSFKRIETGVSEERLLTLARRLTELPPGFSPHVKIQSMMQKRFDAISKDNGIDWGNAETLAYATLVDEGIAVRLSGQDSRRGTFSHRHCVLHDNNNGGTYTPIAGLARNGALFQAWDSLLSEFGVLGFEYGYSLETPNGLVIWEAQFGDFANGAQVIIDQFITSGETKWNRANGLVLLLPHGYEGQGAEHSSARIERYLQICARENIILANPSTPAQIFHLLRRQIKQSFRKPLIVFTPKSLLRHPRCVSSRDELTSGGFQEVLPDAVDPLLIRRILICSGKIYYDLLDERDKRKDDHTAIIRIEQIYPFPSDMINKVLNQFSVRMNLIWVQEEPENMGAWCYIRAKLCKYCDTIRFIGRPEDCCPAVGSHHLHVAEQSMIIKMAFDA